MALLASSLQMETKRDLHFIINFRTYVPEEKISEHFSTEVLEEFEQIHGEYCEKIKQFSEKLLNEVIETLPKEE